MQESIMQKTLKQVFVLPKAKAKLMGPVYYLLVAVDLKAIVDFPPSFYSFVSVCFVFRLGRCSHFRLVV